MRFQKGLFGFLFILIGLCLNLTSSRKWGCVPQPRGSVQLPCYSVSRLTTPVFSDTVQDPPVDSSRAHLWLTQGLTRSLAQDRDLTELRGDWFLDSRVSRKPRSCCPNHLMFSVLTMVAAPFSASGTHLHGFPMTQGPNVYASDYSGLLGSEALVFFIPNYHPFIPLSSPVSFLKYLFPSPAFPSGYQLSILAATRAGPEWPLPHHHSNLLGLTEYLETL